MVVWLTFLPGSPPESATLDSAGMLQLSRRACRAEVSFVGFHPAFGSSHLKAPLGPEFMMRIVICGGLCYSCIYKEYESIRFAIIQGALDLAPSTSNLVCRAYIPRPHANVKASPQIRPVELVFGSGLRDIHG